MRGSNKVYHEKVAVFDLDGTLWLENSHIDILNRYYHTKRFSSLMSRFINRLFPALFLRYLYRMYEDIPRKFIEQYEPRFLDRTVNLASDCDRNGYFVMIISNAPEEIVRNAAKRLSLPYLRTDRADKYKELVKRFEFGKLFVCTDNLSDADLLVHADTKIIYTQRSTEKYFKKHFPDAVFYRKEDLDQCCICRFHTPF